MNIELFKKNPIEFFDNICEDIYIGDAIDEYIDVSILDTGKIDDLYIMANCYFYGISVKKDEKKAFELYEKAMDKGDVDAIMNLAYCYRVGCGVEKDEKKAFKLYEQAMNKGDVDAINNLACCYLVGRGVKKDEGKAFELYMKSSDNGDDIAITHLNYIKDKHKKKFKDNNIIIIEKHAQHMIKDDCICPCCLENISISNAVILPCCHVMHYSCQLSLLQNNRFDCITCRKKF